MLVWRAGARETDLCRTQAAFCKARAGILCPGARLGHRKSPKRAEMKATPAPGGCSAGTEPVGGGGGGVSQEAASLALEGLG